MSPFFDNQSDQHNGTGIALVVEVNGFAIDMDFGDEMAWHWTAP